MKRKDGKITVRFDKERRMSISWFEKSPNRWHTMSFTNAWREGKKEYGFNSALNGMQTLLLAMAEVGVDLKQPGMRKAIRQAYIDLDEFDYEKGAK